MGMTIESQADDPGLTSREREIIRLVAGGMSAKQIALEVGIAPRTVERHIENCRHKLRARNRTHLIAKAIALGELRVGLAGTRSDMSSMVPAE
jgi:DNA-binding CsgD family transcriptional regulator